VDQIFASVVGLVVGAVLLVDQPDVIVAVYQGGHDGFAREIHTGGICRWLPVALPADPGKGVTLDQKRRAFDRWTLVADDQSCPFKPDCRPTGLGSDTRWQIRRSSHDQ